MSSNKLAARLGIGRKAARIRLDHAIEAGAVIVLHDYTRAKTAPARLQPGNAPPSLPRKCFGAFPGVSDLARAWRQEGRG
jgi:hypothetical protein